MPSRSHSSSLIWGITTILLFGHAIILINTGGIKSNYSDLEEFRPEFPRPLFGGLPNQIRLPHLEKPGKPRLSFKAAKGTEIISKGAAVTSSDTLPLIGELSYVTDGDKEGTEGSYVELMYGTQWVQIDLGKTSELWAIIVWHHHTHYPAYRDVVIQVSDDPDFKKNIVTVFNNDHDNSSGLGMGSDPAYVETNHGRIIEPKAITGRYIRLYSNGSTMSLANHYVEVEVWGKPNPTLWNHLRSFFMKRSASALGPGQHPQR